ncbi:hypothetical protein BDV96DRAFT_643173 [Lophiotrema nucula]|uniref:Uncharacterized protein n=1 Tax=Lophiotrema nucula TaxID=690887 RepID=A0A6A5ZJK6_9PLEO|nr:hypothetical protein BDV96DRAFT_643173 [Lophiotrema nucula]
MVDANLPEGLAYRGLVPFKYFKVGFKEVEMTVQFDFNNPITPIQCLLIDYDNQMPRKVVQSLGYMLHRTMFAELAKKDGPWNIIEAGLTTVRLLGSLTVFLRDYRDIGNGHQPTGVLTTPTVNARNPDQMAPTVNLNAGLAAKLLGKHPEEIFKDDILPHWRLQDCENVMRSDLTRRFLNYQRQIRERVSNLDFGELRATVPYQFRRSGQGLASREQLVEYLVKPHITFHGTSTKNVASIVKVVS